MKLFLTKTILLLAVVLIPFLVVEGFISYRMKNNFVVTLHSDWHTLKGHNSDILFIGNSRLWTYVDPKIVSKYTGATCEDLAQDGQSVNVLWHKFLAYSKVNKKPKEIYILTDPLFLKKTNYLYRFDRFRPYLFMDRFDLGPLKKFNEYRIAYKYLPLLAVKDQVLDFILKRSNDAIDFRETRGFKKFDLDWSEGLSWSKPPYMDYFYNDGISYLDTFRRYCEREHIRCYFICTPMSYPTYLNIHNYNKFKQKLNEDMGIYFSDFNGKIYDDSTLFIDHRHLNARGVDIFMKQLLADTSLFKSFTVKR